MARLTRGTKPMGVTEEYLPPEQGISTRMDAAVGKMDFKTQLRGMLKEMDDIVYYPSRVGNMSRDGTYHRPHTRGGGYSKAGHTQGMLDVGIPKETVGDSNDEEDEFRVAAGIGSKWGNRERQHADAADTLNYSEEVEAEHRAQRKQDRGKNHSVPNTLHNQVHTDWPYGRGSTPEFYHPLPLYTPVDTRDENGKAREQDGRVFSRTYFATHVGSIETPGGFLNGLPRAGKKFRPERICGRGVIEDMEKVVNARKQEAKEALFRGERPSLQSRGDRRIAESGKEMRVGIGAIIQSQIRESGGRSMIIRTGGDTGIPLTSFPRDIAKLDQLRRLDLCFNKIEHLSAEICKCTALTLLALDGNKIQQLPQAIGQLKHLRVLSCRNNAIDRLPQSVTSLRSLATLDLSSNSVPPPKKQKHDLTPPHTPQHDLASSHFPTGFCKRSIIGWRTGFRVVEPMVLTTVDPGPYGLRY
ncbi:hypothetical protein T484DRAFT_3276847 [Baffinella frigidus]|nr:hypothetical protein T484DRAFT_3276847 [Cryptophyta sp. CCMP2293]